MAGDWIPMRLDLAEDPAVIAMAEMLSMPEQCVVGYLHSIWSWASRQCNAGSVTGVTVVSLERVTRCAQVPQAMVKVGWLREVDIDGSVALEFPNWERWLSQSAKQRALTSKRVQKSRAEKCNADTVTKSLPQKRREEKKTEEKKKTPNPLCLPAEINTPEMQIAWAEWQQHRREIHEPLTDVSVRKQLAQFVEWGTARSIAAINHTIRKGWQGLREPDAENRGNGAAKHSRVNAALEAMRNADGK